MRYFLKSKRFVVSLFAATLVACTGGPSGRSESHEHGAPEAHGAHGAEETPHASEAAEHGHGAAHEHGHGEGEEALSDLDRPVDELFEARCEHDMKTHECGECRYEVGVVKAVPALFDGGLLEQVRPKKRRAAVPLRLTGEVRFDERRVTHVSTQVGGVIRKVHVTLGDRVKKGDPLVEIDSVEIGKAEAAYQEALAMEAPARRNSERLEALREEGIASEKEVLRAKQELEAAEIRTEAARGMLRRLGSRRVRAGASSGRLVLRAPADGTVLTMHAVTGETVQTAGSVVTIGDNTAVWVWADLYESDLARVRAAKAQGPLTAKVYVKAFPDEPFAGTVDFISPSMTETSRTVKMRVAVPNADGKLLSGMFAELTIFLSEGRETWSLPIDAVLEDEGRAFVFVHHKEDYYVRRPVVRGVSTDEWVEIKAGLTGNETVAANGAFLLKSDVLRSKMGAGCAD